MELRSNINNANNVTSDVNLLFTVNYIPYSGFFMDFLPQNFKKTFVIFANI